MYRNAIIPSLVIFIIAGYLNLFFTRNDGISKKRFITSIGIGIIFAVFWRTREDSIWILPYVFFMSIVLLISILIKNKKITKEFFMTLLILIVPFVITFAYTNVLSYINYKNYGVYTVYNNEQYNKAIKSLKKVKKYDYYDNIDFTTAKLKKVSEVTVLSNIYESLEGLVYGYSLFDSSLLEGEVVNGWFPWALRGALNQNGYYENAQETNNFYYTLHVQIEEALKNGTLEKEDVKPDISSLLKDIFCEVGNVFTALFEYYDIEFHADKVEYNSSYEYKYEMYAKYTNNKFYIYNTETGEDIYYQENMENYEENITPKINIIKQLIEIYKVVSTSLFIIGCVLYLVLSIIVIVNLFKKKFENLEIWIMSSGILGAMLSLIFGIAYETAFNANVITAMYLSAVYPLMIIFGSVLIGSFIIKAIGIINKKTEDRKNKTN